MNLSGLDQLYISDLTDSDYKKITEALTMVNPQYAAKMRFSRWKPKEKDKYLHFYYEDRAKDLIYVPRNTVTNLGLSVSTTDLSNSGVKADIIFTGKLREYQIKYMSKIPGVADFTDAIFEVPCGHGKTALSLYVMGNVKRKTLVFVTTNYLVSQWLERVETFTNSRALALNNKYINTTLPNVSIITLDMYNSLNSAVKDLIFKEVGLVVLDEFHRLGAENYHPILQEIPAEKRLALTATFRRADEKHKLLQLHCGKVYTMENQHPPAKVFPIRTNCIINTLVDKSKLTNPLPITDYLKTLPSADFKQTDTYINYRSLVIDWKKAPLLIHPTDKKILDGKRGEVIYAQLDNYAVEDAARIKLFQGLITKCLKQGRTVLVLSKRKNILKKLHEMYSRDYKSALVISETNKTTPAERKFLAEEAQVIFGIQQLAQEGFDVDRIDTLVLLHPIQDTEQAIGRTERVLPGKLPSLVFYPIDDCSPYLSIYKKSHKFVALNAILQKSIAYSEIETVLNEHKKAITHSARKD